MNKFMMLIVVILGLGASSLGLAYHGYLQILEHPSAGKYLADLEGKSLYIFTNDKPGEGTSTCYDGCATAWPPYLVDTAEIAAHDEFIGDLSVITRTDGTLQLAYNGWPLYYYAGDINPGDTNGHEVGSVWFLVPYGQETEKTN